MSTIDDLLLNASAEDLEDLFTFRQRPRINPFTPVEEIKVSTEEQTRNEVIKSLIASNNALILLLKEREAAVTEPAKIEDTLGEPPPAIKKARAKKATPQPEPLGPPLTNPAEMNEVHQPDHPVREKTMADIKPTKPGKTLADLRVALQDCITKHGMPGAKERLAPHLKISDVPDAEIDAVIKRLLA